MAPSQPHVLLSPLVPEGATELSGVKPSSPRNPGFGPTDLPGQGDCQLLLPQGAPGSGET